MQLYPDGVEAKLGFDVLRDRLSGHVKSPLGQERLDGMQPARTIDWLRAELDRVAEMQAAYRFDDGAPLDHVYDLRPTLRQAAPEDAFVDAEALWDVRLVLVTLRRLKRFFEDRAADYPSLAESVERITPLRDLEEHIRSIIDENGSVRDDATETLARLRQQIRSKQNELRDTLDRALRSAIRQGYATEEQPTIRAGRMVIPVRAEAKRKVDGFVHDTSASGQTVYIEPAACLELNNEVQELKADARREVERILREATSRLSARRDAMDANLKALAQFDLLQAKARLANHLDAAVPQLSTDGVIELHDSRNPVLQLHFEKRAGDDADAARRGASSGSAPTPMAPDAAADDFMPTEVVPLDLTLGEDFETLVITGPNAGGKTVTMKTVGLLALMLAYGLPIPAAPHSKMPLFDRLMVDLGDEQSIEDDLSTFSSHVSNMRQMMQAADENTLVLIDEAGTGTDPDEGGALAQAILERLTDAGARTIATTHHGTLKVYAHETDGVENGSMAFDQETLRPTYEYQEGIPGSSYAFEIARRMGLEDDVLARAGELAGERKTAMEDLIATFEERNQRLEDRLYEAEKELEQAKQEREQYAAKRRKIDKEREEIRQQALEEAERIVQEANARVERTIREIKEAQAEKEATKKAREALEDYKDEVATRREEGGDGAVGEPATEADEPAEPSGADPQENKPRPPAQDGPIEAGDEVVVDDGSTVLEVQEVDDDEALVIMGSMHMRVDLDRLTKVGRAENGADTPSGSASAGSGTPGGSSGTASMTALRAERRIDVRGARVEGAKAQVQQFIDDAIAADLDEVEILHGKGTGALREALHEMLRQRSDIAAFDTAPLEEGGAGVTIAELA